MIGYPVLMIEHERDWGSNPEGYFVFNSAEAREKYIREQTAGRNAHQVPDYYVEYANVEPFTLLPESEKRFGSKDRFYTDHLTINVPLV